MNSEFVLNSSQVIYLKTELSTSTDDWNSKQSFSGLMQRILNLNNKSISHTFEAIQTNKCSV